jgi:hypothetical protein
MGIALRLAGLLAAGLFFVACAGQSPGRLVRTAQPTAAELRQNWQRYRVYCFPDSALIFKEPGAGAILLDAPWREATDAAALNAVGFRGPLSPVFQITGAGGAAFGYLLYTVGDSVGVAVIDPQTVKIYYSIPRKGGP